MAHFAKLDSNNIVIGPHVVNESDCTDDNGRSEQKGITFLNKLHKWPYWKEYRKDGSIRTRPATLGGTYSTEHDAFIAAKPYPSWALNGSTLDWDPPTPFPGGVDKNYEWNEATLLWDEYTAPGAQ